MSIGAPEFSRIVRLDEIERTRWPAHISADESECAALARRFGFLSLEKLAAGYSMARDGFVVVATGMIEGALSQACVATGEPVAETVHEDFLIRFVPEEKSGAAPDSSEEIELDAGECDILTFSGERIDIGEAVAETLALAANPYPRSAQADVTLRAAGVLTEDQAGPFAVLAALKKGVQR